MNWYSIVLVFGIVFNILALLAVDYSKLYWRSLWLGIVLILIGFGGAIVTHI